MKASVLCYTAADSLNADKISRMQVDIYPRFIAKMIIHQSDRF